MFIKKTKYSGTPKYRCDMCGKIVDYRPTRVTSNSYRNQAYRLDFNCDMCYDCYNKFNMWVKKGWRYREKR